MAAKQAGDIVENETHVEVIPTKTIPEGLVACSVFNVEGTVEDNLQSMKENIDGIQSGEVTYAIKDTTIDGITVGKNKFMGISQKKILCCHKHKTHTLYDLLKQMVTEDSQIITVIYGKDVTKEEQDEITKTLNNTYGKSMDVSIEYGGQPVYSFFVSVE